MIIKLLEQPIIAIHEAEIAGTVDGVIIKDDRVSCIYHRNMENQFAIPVENVIIGDDAVMVQDITALTMAPQSIKPMKALLEVYNLSGSKLGCLHGIEVDDKLCVRYIIVDDNWIEISKVINYESVVIVDIELDDMPVEEDLTAKEPGKDDTAETAAVEAEEAIDTAEAEADEVSMAIGPEIKWNEDDNKAEEKSSDNPEFSVVRPIYQNPGKETVPGVDSKYAYLCGKQLLEGIDIESTFYEKGTVIGAELIKHAIASNAIVTVIVNAED